jgi:pimeloyl-ACP methyl ester carboxylesterase
MHKEIKFRNGTISFSSHGAGRCVVLLHGFLEQKEMWDAIVLNLSKRYKVICIDLPGHGKSESFGYVHEMEFIAEAVNAVLKNLRLRRFFIAGHSMGGYAALAFAEKFPKKIKGLCLVNSTAYADSDERKQLRLRAIDVVKKNHRLYVSETVPNLFSAEFRNNNRQLVETIKQWGLAMTPSAITASIEGMRRRKDRMHIATSKNFPVFYIAGTKDETIPLEISLAQTKHLPENQTCIIENSGHMSYLEYPEETLRALQKFIRNSFRTSTIS